MNAFRIAYVYVRNHFAGVLEETDEGSEQYVLSPTYDFLPVNVNMPSDNEQPALALNGKKMNIQKKTF